MDRQSMGDGFFDDDGIGGYDLRQFVGDPTGVDGFLFFATDGVFLPTRPARIVSAAPGFGAARGVAGSFENFFLDGIEQIFHRAFDLSGEDLIDRKAPVGKFRAQRVVRQNRDFGSRVQFL